MSLGIQLGPGFVVTVTIVEAVAADGEAHAIQQVIRMLTDAGFDVDFSIEPGVVKLPPNDLWTKEQS